MINWKPINELIDGEYLEDKSGIIPRHNFITGLKNYVLATLEQLMGYLSITTVNDDMIKFLSSSLYTVAQRGNERYFEVIQEVYEVIKFEDNIDALIQKIKENFKDNILTDAENLVVSEIASMNYREYLD